MIGLILSPTIGEYSAYVLLSLCMLTHALSLLLYGAFYIRSRKKPGDTPSVAMRPVDWQTMVMYLLFVASVFLLLFTSGDSSLREVLPKGIYLFLRFASIVGTMGILAFFIGEKLPREKFDPEKFPFKCAKWEKEGKIYDNLGLRYWKTHVPDMSKYFPRAFSKQGNFSRDPAHLRRLVQETCSAEAVHWDADRAELRVPDSDGRIGRTGDGAVHHWKSRVDRDSKVQSPANHENHRRD